MNKRKRIGRQLLCLIVSFVMIMTLIPRMPGNLAYAVAGDVPTHTKNLTNNQDGTYKLSLDVKGEAEKKVTKTNVTVVLDVSGSMKYPTENISSTGRYGYLTGSTSYCRLYNGNGNEITNNSYSGTVYYYDDGWYEYTGPRYTSTSGTKTRLDAAKTAVNSLANTLLGYNGKDGNPADTFELALVSFSNVATTNRKTNSYNTFSQQVNALSADGGTNWEDGLQDANSVNYGDNDNTFVIFVSDGNPTFRNTRGDYNNLDYNQTYYNRYGIYGTGSDSNATTVERCYNHARDDAKAIVDGGKTLYTIGAYGNVDRMSELNEFAGGSGYYSANDTASLEAALKEIVEKIQMAGFANVEIDDGTPANIQVGEQTTDVADLLEVEEGSFKYYRSGGTYGTKTEWTDIPEECKAVNDNGQVKWDLASLGVLENGVTYTVEFNVYPSQYTYDTIAQLKNGDIQYSDLNPEVQKYIVDDGGGSYSLRTNTNAVLNYDDTRTDAKEDPVNYVNPDPVATDAATMSVTKEWENKLDAREVGSIDMTVLMGGEEFHKVTLTDPSWKQDGIFISPGIIKNGKVLPGAEGHDFTFAELGSEQYNWELVAPTVHPMIIDSNLTMLTMVDDAHPAPTGAQTYTINGKTYYSNGSSSASLDAYNYRRSNLNLTKVVTGEDAPKDATFPFTLTVNNGKASTGSADDTNSDYYVWFSIYDTVAKQTVTDATITGATGPNDTGYYYAPSGTAITVQMKNGWNLRFTNLPTETTYTFVEGDLADGFAFNKATLSGGEDSTFSGGKTTTGTVENTNTSYTVTYTNDYQLTDLEVTKVWDDANNQDGKRLTADELKAKLTLSPTVDGKDATVVDNGDGTYTITYKDLPRFNNGNEVEYTVTESKIDGYTTTDSTAKDHGTITNKHTPETTEATVVKVWDDSNNQDGKRPPSLEVTLSNGNKVTLNEGNKWTATVSNLPKYSNGTEINYTWTEGEMPEGYRLTNTVKNGTVTTFTNSYTPENTTVNAEKIWKSGSTTLTEAPEDITLHLNKKVGTADAVVVDRQDKTIAKGASGDALKVSWTGLPKYEAGQLITYTVTEDTVAGYTTTITGDAATGFVITNSNVTVDTSTEAILNKNVTVENKVKASTFTFDMVEVTDATGETPVTGAETITGEVTYAAGEKGTKIVDFGELTYGGGTEYPEVHYYKITEKNIPDGWTATPVSAVATVTIQKSADGSLEATVTPAQINNAYSVASTTYTLSASKTLRVESGNNAPDVSGKYDLTLKDANGNVVGTVKQNPDGKGTAVEFETITYTAAGDYVYTVSETCNAEGGKIDGVTDDPEAAGKTVIVSVTDDGEGHLSAAIKEGSGSQKTNFTNVYNAAPAELELSASKTLSKASNAANPPTVDRKYDLTLTAVDNAPMPEGATNGSISVKNPDGAGTAESFGKITYTVPGTYTYTISESGEAIAGVTNDADAAGKTVVVTVTDDGKGKLIASVTTGGAKTNFTNTYSVTDSEPVKLEAAKVLQGRNLKAGEFSFELKGADGTVIETAANGAGGAVEFETEFTYSAVGDYTYTINEVIPENKLPNVEYDSSEKEVVIHVADNGEGALVATVEYKGVEEEGDVPTFTNVYTPGPTEANISLTKELTGRTLKAGEFSFTMTDAEGETVETVNNDKDGNVNFSAIEYNAEGEYTYTIKENIPTGDDKLGGVTYSEEAIEVTVNVTYSADTGLYTATVNYPTDKTFNNDYTAEPTSATLTATKVLTGRPLVAGEFSFELKDAEGNVLQTATNAADGSVTFTPIAYEFGDDGEYTYTISEVKGKLGGVTYDEHVATAKVVVTDDLKGNMAAAVTYYNGETPIEGAPVFNNTYAPSPTDATIVVTKELTGRTLKAGEFSFSLVDKDGKLVGTATNAADGKVTFTVKGIDKVGTYTYTVSENIPADEDKLGGVTYASNTVEVSVEVTDDLAGKLVAETKYPAVTKFVNEYKANGSFNPEVTKVYEGDDELVAGLFKFEIFDSEGTKIGEATNDAEGKVTFGALNYTEQNVGKTYTYTIKEVKGDKRFVTYDDTVITLTVTVVDNGDGTLSFTKEYKDTSTFTNIFKIIYGNLNVNKTLDTIYDVDAENKDDVNTTVVFSVKAVLDGEKVYDDVVSIDFSNGGTLPAEVVGKIPVGSVVTVEEIYCSGSYKLTAGPEPTTVTIEEEGQTVEIAFTNTYTNKLIQGYGILNEYSKEEGKDWIHNGSQEKEAED